MIDFSSISTNAFTPSRPEPSDTSSDSSTKSSLNPDNSDKSDAASETGKQKGNGAKIEQDLNTEEVRELTKLKQRDREVRAHEQAHIAAGGIYVRSGAHYEYEKGPNGKNYAVGGEVQIDTSKVQGDPQATLRKMQTVRRAAMAPASPSAQDRSVSAKATQMENKARLEILTQRYEEAAALRTDAHGNETGDSDATDTESRNPNISLGGLIDTTQ